MGGRGYSTIATRNLSRRSASPARPVASPVMPLAAQRSTAQRSTAQRSAVQAQRSAAQHSTAQRSTAQRSTFVLTGMQTITLSRQARDKHRNS